MRLFLFERFTKACCISFPEFQVINQKSKDMIPGIALTAFRNLIYTYPEIRTL